MSPTRAKLMISRLTGAAPGLRGGAGALVAAVGGSRRRRGGAHVRARGIAGEGERHHHVEAERERRHHARRAVEEAALEHEAAHEPPGGSRDQRGRAGSAAALPVGRGLQPRIAAHAREHVGVVAEAVVVDRPGQLAHLARRAHRLVHRDVVEARVAAVEQPQGPVGRPDAVAHLARADVGAPAQAPGHGGIRERERLECGDELGVDHLVGVDHQHPVVGRELDRALLLAAEAEPVLALDARARGRGDGQGAVARARVDDQDLVAPGQRRQRAGEMALGVLGDHHRGELRSPAHARGPSRSS